MGGMLSGHPGSSFPGRKTKPNFRKQLTCRSGGGSWDWMEFSREYRGVSSVRIFIVVKLYLDQSVRIHGSQVCWDGMHKGGSWSLKVKTRGLQNPWKMRKVSGRAVGETYIWALAGPTSRVFFGIKISNPLLHNGWCLAVYLASRWPYFVPLPIR